MCAECQAVEVEQQAQRRLLEETLASLNTIMQGASAQEQQKADVDAFRQEIMVSCCISEADVT